MPIEFELPKEKASIIKVLGVGGGGSNAVNHMYGLGIKGVDFFVCNTDAQHLERMQVPNRIQIGTTLTEGRGAGSIPNVGRNAAIESIDEIKEVLQNRTTMVFITAGMGGGTGTGAAPVIAQAAKEMGILTVGIVTIPFAFEGPRRKSLAEMGLEEMRKSVDTLLIIKNDKLREVCGNLSVTKAFAESDSILTTAAKGIADVISTIGYINVDMNDVNTIMKDSGVAIMGSGMAEGDERAMKAVKQALESPLLNDNEIKGARHILLNIAHGKEDITMDELSEITDFIQKEAGMQAEVIMGYGQDDSLENEVSITVIATGFDTNLPDMGIDDDKEPEKVMRELDEDVPVIITKPIERPIENPVAEDLSIEIKKEEELEPFLMKKEPENIQPDIDEVEEETPQMGIDFQEPILRQISDLDKDFVEPDEEEIKPIINEPANNEKQYFKLEDEELVDQQSTFNAFETPAPKRENEIDQGPTLADVQRLNDDRLKRIRENTMKLRNPDGLAELESVPAYKRNNTTLEKVVHSSDSEISRLSINNDGTPENPKIQIKENNSFLHDNVD